MATAPRLVLNSLDEHDETAWLEAMSSLAANGLVAEMDFENLSEYLRCLDDVLADPTDS
jgi:hypothetical protein